MNNFIPAVDKAVQLLEALSSAPASQAALSTRLGISPSTTYRILVTLCAHNWIVKNSDGLYQLSQGLLPLFHSLSADAEILERARLRVSAIAAEYKIACKLSLRRGIDQLTDFRAEPLGPVALTGQAGSTFPLIEGSVGAALLSKDSEKSVMQYVSACPVAIPEKEDPELLLSAIREVRTHGSVLNCRENRWRIAALSAPIHNRTGKVIAALTLISTVDELTEDGRGQWDEVLRSAIAFCEAKEEHPKQILLH